MNANRNWNKNFVIVFEKYECLCTRFILCFCSCCCCDGETLCDMRSTYVVYKSKIVFVTMEAMMRTTAMVFAFMSAYNVVLMFSLFVNAKDKVIHCTD